MGDGAMTRLVVLSNYEEIVKVFNEYGNEVGSDFAMYTKEGIYRVYKHFEKLEEGLYVVIRVRPKTREAFYEVILLEEPNVELIDVGVVQISEVSDENIYEIAKNILKKYRYKRKAETEVV